MATVGSKPLPSSVLCASCLPCSHPCSALFIPLSSLLGTCYDFITSSCLVPVVINVSSHLQEETKVSRGRGQVITLFVFSFFLRFI